MKNQNTIHARQAHIKYVYRSKCVSALSWCLARKPIPRKKSSLSIIKEFSHLKGTVIAEIYELH